MHVAFPNLQSITQLTVIETSDFELEASVIINWIPTTGVHAHIKSQIQI